MWNLRNIWPFFPGSFSWYVLYSGVQAILIFILCCAAIYMGLTFLDFLLKIAMDAFRYLDSTIASLFLLIGL